MRSLRQGSPAMKTCQPMGAATKHRQQDIAGTRAATNSRPSAVTPMMTAVPRSGCLSSSARKIPSSAEEAGTPCGSP